MRKNCQEWEWDKYFVGNHDQSTHRLFPGMAKPHKILFVLIYFEDVYPDQARAGLVIQMRMPIYHQSPIEKEDSLSVSDSDTDPI